MFGHFSMLYMKRLMPYNGQRDGGHLSNIMLIHDTPNCIASKLYFKGTLMQI